MRARRRVIIGLLLAAGGARRFGSQKLAASLNGVPLVRRAFESLAHATDAVMVVVGSEPEMVTRALAGTAATIVENRAWASGLASSIRCGVLAAPPNAEALVIALADEPSIDPRVTRGVIRRWRETGTPIVVARYESVQGHPVLFERSVFGELAALEGDVGAKRVIGRDAARVEFVDVAAEPPIDVDVPDDLRRLERRTPVGEIP